MILFEIYWFVVSNPLKNISQNGFIFPKRRVKIFKYLSCHHLEKSIIPPLFYVGFLGTVFSPVIEDS